ncbi:SLAM family member 7 [Rhynchocyon petersi]
MFDSPMNFILIFLFCQLTGPAASGAVNKLVGALGGSVTFPLKHSVKHVSSIVWIFKTTLVTSQVENANNSPLIIVHQSLKKNRTCLDENHSLMLSTLQKNDSGTYRVEVHSSSDQPPFTQDYVLHVYEQLSEPKVIRSWQNKENGTCMANLTCSMRQGKEDVTYSWITVGQEANKSQDGSTLPISWRLWENNMTFICMVRNPISSNSSTPISSWELCKGALLPSF